MSFVYKGLSANFEKLTVTDHELERLLVRLQQQTPRAVPVTDRAAKLGDEVVLDYAGFVDGKQFEMCIRDSCATTTSISRQRSPPCSF